MHFTDLGLSADILRAVSEQGYDTPTPIQAQAIPVVLAGRDLMAAAQTGTGKTAGFTLPILQLLSTRAAVKRGKPRCLVLVPTRELAVQVHESVRTYGKHLPIKATAIFGGVGMGNQLAALKHGVDIIVATPGRLLDHIEQKTADLSAIEILVLDEADRMLDMGFIRDIRKVIALLPKKKQTLLFSATFSDEIKKLADGFMHDPLLIEVARRNATAELIEQRVRGALDPGGLLARKRPLKCAHQVLEAWGAGEQNGRDTVTLEIDLLLGARETVEVGECQSSVPGSGFVR